MGIMLTDFLEFKEEETTAPCRRTVDLSTAKKTQAAPRHPSEKESTPGNFSSFVGSPQSPSWRDFAGGWRYPLLRSVRQQASHKQTFNTQISYHIYKSHREQSEVVRSTRTSETNDIFLSAPFRRGEPQCTCRTTASTFRSRVCVDGGVRTFA